MELKVTYNSCYIAEELIQEHGEDSVGWITEIKYLVEDYIKRFKSPPPIGMYFTLMDSGKSKFVDYTPLKVDRFYYSSKSLEICLEL
jgi:hypothetical protein